MKATILGLGIVVAFLFGCGGGSDGAPTVHSIDDGHSQRAPAETYAAVGPFALPAGATVTYDIVDMPTGIGDDTMDSVVATAANVQSAQIPIPGYGVRMGFASTGATTPALPADSYFLAVYCRNAFDECFFRATISATY